MAWRKKGFTILEVVLILGASGLIILGVFIAVPTIQANQRDADRKSNVNKVVAAIKNYQTNNSRGALPSGSADLTANQIRNYTGNDENTWIYLIKNYVRDIQDYNDPNGKGYEFDIYSCLGASNAGDSCSNAVSISNYYNMMFIITGATCESGTAVKSNNNRNVAVVQSLERGEGFYCAST